MLARPAPIDVPNKQTFKPAEVCELLAIPAYVLRTWENEFKDLGESSGSGGSRIYRRSDVELAVRIRDLVFTEHLTLAGVRRKLEHESLLPSSDAEPQPVVAEVAVASSVQVEKLQEVKRELRELLHRLATGARQELRTRESTDAKAAAAPEAPPGGTDAAMNADPVVEALDPESAVWTRDTNPAMAASAGRKSAAKSTSRPSSLAARTGKAPFARGKK